MTTTVKHVEKSSSMMYAGSLETEHNPHIPLKYNVKFLPNYAAAVSRPVEELFAVEDLDFIQPEFENLLSKVVLRHRNLKSDYDCLDKDEKRLERRSKQSEMCPSPVKKKREDARKSKTSPLKPSKHKSNPNYSPPLNKILDEGINSLHVLPQQREHRVMLPKNDTPNKFWLSVEPFCMSLTNEDLRLLDDLLEQYSGPLVPPIPSFGQSYPLTWTTDDFNKVKEISNSSYLLQKTDNLSGECISGPLTQRLVSSLLEHFDNKVFEADSKSCSENENLSNFVLQSFSYMKNGIDVEKRLQNELIKQGVLECQEIFKKREDEILSEIKSLGVELSAVSDYNGNALKNMREAALIEIKRLELKRKLDTIDHEILEAYKKGVAIRAKRKVMYSEDHQDVLRLISEQKVLTDQLQKFKRQ